MASNEAKLAIVCILIIVLGCLAIWHTQKRIQEEIWWADATTPQYFEGEMYEAMFCDHVLTPEELVKLLNSKPYAKNVLILYRGKNDKRCIAADGYLGFDTGNGICHDLFTPEQKLTQNKYMAEEPKDAK